jgi:hypothetical protein
MLKLIFIPVAIASLGISTGAISQSSKSTGPATSAGSKSKPTVAPKKRQSPAYSTRAKVPAKRLPNAANSKLPDTDPQSIANSGRN